MDCRRCGAELRAEAAYCEMCGTPVPGRRSGGGTRHGLTGTGVIVVVAASMTALAMLVGIIVLVRALVA